MAVERHKYEMYAEIRYDGRLIDVLDRIRAIRLVLMVHIEQDVGPDRELIKIKEEADRTGEAQKRKVQQEYNRINKMTLKEKIKYI